jgi:hypothetical protein
MHIACNKAALAQEIRSTELRESLSVIQIP